jgi:hypothetical protein
MFFLGESLNSIVIKPRTFSYHGRMMLIPVHCLFNISYQLKYYANPVIMTCFFLGESFGSFKINPRTFSYHEHMISIPV